MPANFRFFPISALLLLCCACEPPVKTLPRRAVTGLPPTDYVAVLEGEKLPAAAGVRYLVGLRVKDRGWSRDCEYPEVVERARNKAMRLGGNILLITRHQLPSQTGSSCSRISAEVYLAEKLEGLEPQIRWSTARRLLTGDLPLRQSAAHSPLPALRCTLKYRLLGDFYNDFTVRTQAVIAADSTWRSGDPATDALLLRRAQLQFDLAELGTRTFKTRLTAMAPDLRAMTGQAKSLMTEQQQAWRQRAADFDLAWQNAGRSEAVLQEWERKVAEELAATASLAADVTVSLHKQDYRKSD